ncbi:hypothetical protein PGN61_21060 [Klebsiella aerogenes]
MKLFEQYIEIPIQSFDSIDGVTMPNGEYKQCDSTLINIYSLMMNHQDNSQKNRSKFYIESLDSIAYLTHCSRATATRKVNELIQMGLLIKKARHRDSNIWEVLPLKMISKHVKKRPTNRELWESKILANQNDSQDVQNDSQDVQNDSQDVQNDSQDVQNDSGNSSITSSSANSELSVLLAVKDTDLSALLEESEIESNSPSTVSNNDSELENDKNMTSPLETISTVPIPSTVSRDKYYISPEKEAEYLKNVTTQKMSNQREEYY